MGLLTLFCKLGPLEWPYLDYLLLLVPPSLSVVKFAFWMSSCILLPPKNSFLLSESSHWERY